MKGKTAFYPLIILLAAMLAFTSCKKSTEDKLLGTWKMINVVDVSDTTRVENWEFKANGELVIYYREPGLGVDTVEKYVSRFNMEGYRKFSVSGMTNEHLPQYNTTWDIIKLKKDLLMISNDAGGGLYFREFQKM